MCPRISNIVGAQHILACEVGCLTVELLSGERETDTVVSYAGTLQSSLRCLFLEHLLLGEEAAHGTPPSGRGGCSWDTSWKCKEAGIVEGERR